MKTKKHKYWYKITHRECVMGDISKTYKERMYTRKPKDWRKRIFYEQYLCGNHY